MATRVAMHAAACNARYFDAVSEGGARRATRLKVAAYESWRELREAWGVTRAGDPGTTSLPPFHTAPPSGATVVA